jgi:hypothetical protein
MRYVLSQYKVSDSRLKRFTGYRHQTEHQTNTPQYLSGVTLYATGILRVRAVTPVHDLYSISLQKASQVARMSLPPHTFQCPPVFLPTTALASLPMAQGLHRTLTANRSSCSEHATERHVRKERQRHDDKWMTTQTQYRINTGEMGFNFFLRLPSLCVRFIIKETKFR